MRSKFALVLICLLTISGICAGLVLSQDKKEDKSSWEAPKPTKEHKLLKMFEGTWSYKAKFKMDEKSEWMESSGTETTKMSLGGFWLISNSKCESSTMSFEGHGVFGYDTARKQYVSMWIDSMSSSMTTSEGIASKDEKTITLTGQTRCPMTNELITMKFVYEITDENNFIFSMYMPAKDGKEYKSGEITYIKNKANHDETKHTK
ncbi:MAG: DUF1579 domain-containing protein [Planctomycetes bacterium]|nr:DUF1579 domain-containing protein [Planctomycetota bacterium]